MRRILLVLAIAALMATMLGISALPAMAQSCPWWDFWGCNSAPQQPSDVISSDGSSLSPDYGTDYNTLIGNDGGSLIGNDGGS